jgi:hypothetical protein
MLVEPSCREFSSLGIDAVPVVLLDWIVKIVRPTMYSSWLGGG